MDRLTESALLSLGRLDEALANHPLAASWIWQATIDASLRAAADDGNKVEIGQFLAVQADLPVHPEARDSEAVAEALLAVRAAEMGFALRDPQNDDDFFTRDAILSLADRMVAQLREPGSADLSRLEGLARGIIDGIGISSRDALLSPALALALRAVGLVRHLLPGIGRPRSARGEEPLQAFLLSVTRDADAGHAKLMALGHQHSRWQRQLAQRDAERGITRRSSSRAPSLLSHLLRLPVATPEIVAEQLGTTPRGAALILEELEEAGILTRADAALRWRAWIPSCFSDVAEAIHVSRGWS